MGRLERLAKMDKQSNPPMQSDRPALARGLFVARLGWWPLLLAGVFLLGTAVALPLDGYCAGWLGGHRPPPPVRKLLQLSELFGHGIGILLIGLVIFQLDVARRWAVPRVLLAALGAGIVADIVKVLVARVRPRYCGLESSVGQVVHGWFVVAGEGKSQSFPSGHAAAAVALALALAALYPRGKWLFAALAFSACWQRLDEAAHFPSDLLLGAAIGSLVAAACVCRSPLASLFDRREAQLRSLAAAWRRRFSPAGRLPGSGTPA